MANDDDVQLIDFCFPMIRFNVRGEAETIISTSFRHFAHRF